MARDYFREVVAAEAELSHLVRSSRYETAEHRTQPSGNRELTLSWNKFSSIVTGISLGFSGCMRVLIVAGKWRRQSQQQETQSLKAARSHLASGRASSDDSRPIAAFDLNNPQPPSNKPGRACGYSSMPEPRCATWLERRCRRGNLRTFIVNERSMGAVAYEHPAIGEGRMFPLRMPAGANATVRSPRPSASQTAGDIPV